MRSKHFTELNIEAFECFLEHYNIGELDEYVKELTSEEELKQIINSLEKKLEDINAELEKENLQ